MCRYFAFQLILGAAVALALAELLWPDNQVDILESSVDSDAYMETPDIQVDIPEWLLRYELIPLKEPSPLAVAEAERIVGSRR